MTFEADAQSIEDSDRRDGIEIILPAVTYRIATGRRDRIINGQTFRASPAGRSTIAVPTSAQDGDAVIELPCDHPIAVRYSAGGVPPKKITVKIWQLQVRSGTEEIIWNGEVTSCEFVGDVARFRVPSRFSEALDVRLPTISAGRTCGHVLYDSNCRVNREDFKVIGTVIARLGNQLIISTIDANPNLWAQFGELVHVDSGETMTVFDQIGTTITLQFPIHELQPGDDIELFAGCDHLLTTCFNKFQNEENFGGFNLLPRFNPHTLGGLGVSTLV